MASNCVLSDETSANKHPTVDDDVIHYVTATKEDTSVLQCNVSNRHGYIYTNIALTIIGQCLKYVFIRLLHSALILASCLQPKILRSLTAMFSTLV